VSEQEEQEEHQEQAEQAEHHEGHEHDHDDHDDHEGHDHEHDHTLIVDRLPAGVWLVDHEASEVNFRARAMFGLVPVNGFFDGFSGELRVDEQGKVQGSLVVQTGTLKTGIGRRDADLKSGSYFGAEEYPEMIFTIDSIEPGREDHLTLTGNLALRDKTIPLSFPVYVIEHGDHLHIEGRIQVNHQAAGLGWAKPGMVGKTVRADVALTLTSGG
jgi:polyisoprenoid-binding protein YceI